MVKTGGRGRRAATKRAERSRWDASVNPALSFLVCSAALVASSFLALRLSNPDQGRVVTLEGMRRQVEQNYLRIQNDPNMPPQAKAYALGMIRRSKEVGRRFPPTR